MHLSYPVLGVVACAWCAPLLAQGRAPVVYSGQMISSYRVTTQEDTERTVQRISSANLNADTYFWQPWLATGSGRLFLSTASTTGSQSTDNTVVTGDGRLTLFPPSRFPFEAFVSATDSRVSLEDVGTNTGDFRQTRVGIQQRYRPLHGHSSFLARLEHDEQTFNDFDDGSSNRLRLQGTYTRERHAFSGEVSIEDSRQDVADVQQQSTVVNLRHSYRPKGALFVESFASYSDFDLSSLEATNRVTDIRLDSRAQWSPRERPLVVTARASLDGTRTRNASLDEDVYNADAEVFATYQYTPQLRFTGQVGARVLRDGEEDVQTFQSATVNYAPDGLDLAGFTYSWSTGAGASNNTGEGDASNRILSADIGHAISRVIPLDWWSGKTLLSVNASQSLSEEYETVRGDRGVLTHLGSLSLVRTRGRSSANLRANLTDSRVFGRESIEVQSIGLNGNYNARLRRATLLSAGFSLQVTRSGGSNLGGDTREFSSLEASLRQGQVFGVPRLNFHSELRVSSDSLIPLRSGDEDLLEIDFENRLDYTIGLLNVGLEAIYTETNSRGGATVMLTIRRSLAGVF